MNFFKWLTESSHDDPDIKELAALAKANKETWSKASSQSEFKNLIDSDQTIAGEDKKQLTNTLTKVWSNSSHVRQEDASFVAFVHRASDVFEKNAPMLVIGAFGILLLGFLFWAILDADFFSSLARVEVARGLITFFFAMGTVGVALILVTATFTSNKADLKERFDNGKQVLMALIGVFGTIVGFYFGQSTVGQPSESAAPSAEEAQPASETPTPAVLPGEGGEQTGETLTPAVLPGEEAEQTGETPTPAVLPGEEAEQPGETPIPAVLPGEGTE